MAVPGLDPGVRAATAVVDRLTSGILDTRVKPAYDEKGGPKFHRLFTNSTTAASML